MDKPTSSSEKLIYFLSQPDSYPHKPDTVEHVQTHISHVFIASPYVYKLKKAVDFDFLDYSTLAKRKKYCQREIELNRRLCDDVYLGVVSIIKQNDGFAFSDQSKPGDVVEYAVKMKQLPEEYFLHSYLESGTLTFEHLDRVANKLADFYNRQQPGKEILKWGAIENIKVNTDENFSQTKPFVGQTIGKNAYRAIKHFTNQYYQECRSLFERRIKEKRIVDGHGDLHLEHIHITPEKVRIYDCIEFNERFRFGDLAADLAFLVMDLDFNDRWQEAQYFINQMADKLDDKNLLQIIDFYKCYRAYVKGKVKSLQSTEEEVPEKERERAAKFASRYFNLALRYALLGSHPTALVFMGRVGTGKSTLARHLNEKLSLEYLSTDRIRKKMAGVPLEQRTAAAKRDEIYSAPMSQKTYEQLFKKAEACLQAGRSVILDATFSSRASRQNLIERLAAKDVRLFFVEAQAPTDILKQRLKERDHQQGVISDARLEDFEHLNNRYESPDKLDEHQLIKVDTDQRPEESILQLYLELVGQNVLTLPAG